MKLKSLKFIRFLLLCSLFAVFAQFIVSVLGIEFAVIVYMTNGAIVAVLALKSTE